MNKMIVFCIIAMTMTFYCSVSYAQWEYERVNCDVLDYEIDASIKIAVIDSGIVKNDITNEYIAGGYNFIEDSEDYTDTLGNRSGY